VGSYLDREPALKAAKSFQARGLLAFTVKKTLVEKKIALNQPIGDFWLLLVGLFGDSSDALALGKRLYAQGLVTSWESIPADRPSEMEMASAQSQPLVKISEEVTAKAAAESGRPMPTSSPAVTGQGFKDLVKGRFVGSFRDREEAKREAARLTGAGWPASVEETAEGGGTWFRVFISEARDRRDFSSDPRKLEAAKAQSARQAGMVLLIDGTGLKGVWGYQAPAQDRKDASACAGYSKAGRLLTGIERLVGLIPDKSQLMVVKPILYNPAEDALDWVTRPVKSWWSGDDSQYVQSRSSYGPIPYNRNEVMAKVRAIKPEATPRPLGPALDSLGELRSISGRKTVVLFSEFGLPDKGPEALAALGRLKGQYGSDLDFLVVYGDSDDQGYLLAQNLAKSGGSGEAYDGCRLLADKAYFQRFAKRVLRP
jgi:hypothetical protein